MARTPREINWDMVEKRMEAGNKAKEIAHAHGLDLDVFYDRFKQHFSCGFADYAGKSRALGCSNIEFTQYTKALQGSNQMLQLLGKEWCKQGQDEVKTSPFEDSNSLKHENMILRAELAEMKEKLNANKSQAGQELS